jgi:hypothetical protein
MCLYELLAKGSINEYLTNFIFESTHLGVKIILLHFSFNSAQRASHFHLSSGLIFPNAPFDFCKNSLVDY